MHKSPQYKGRGRRRTGPKGSLRARAEGGSCELLSAETDPSQAHSEPFRLRRRPVISESVNQVCPPSTPCLQLAPPSPPLPPSAPLKTKPSPTRTDPRGSGPPSPPPLPHCCGQAQRKTVYETNKTRPLSSPPAPPPAPQGGVARGGVAWAGPAAPARCAPWLARLGAGRCPDWPDEEPEQFSGDVDAVRSSSLHSNTMCHSVQGSTLISQKM